MFHFTALFASLKTVFWRGALLVMAPPPAPAPSCDSNAQDIGKFFGSLTGDLTIFALAMAGFFFALAALFYMAAGATGNERTRTHAVGSLYAAMSGLALALLAGSVSAIVSGAVPGFNNACG